MAGAVSKLLTKVNTSVLTQVGMGDGDSPTSGSRLPEVFGDYILTDKLGSGGLAEVFKGYREDDPSQSPVTIKRLLRQESLAQRLLREEARIARGISDGHVLKVLELGEVSGKLYLRLEFVDGADLATILTRVRRRQQAFSTEVSVNVLIDICRGLQALHEYRDPETGRPSPIVHCDLKPGNILIGRDGQIKICDLGVARRENEHSIAPLDEMAGTEAYLAPERLIWGKHRKVDRRSDIFSLGVMAYEMASRRPLFTGTSASILQQLINADTFVPQKIEDMPSYVHPDLTKVIARLLEVDPEKRYQRVREVISDLSTLRDRLRLTANVAHFVAPYLKTEAFEESADRVTGKIPGRPDGRVIPEKDESFSGPITHLTVDQLTQLLRKPREIAAAPALISEQRAYTRKRRLFVAALWLFTLATLSVAAWFATPLKVEIESKPKGAMVYVKPGCEGRPSTVQPAPLAYHFNGPWPLCLEFKAPGYITHRMEVFQPESTTRTKRVEAVMTKDVCASVDSKPHGLPVYVDNTYYGLTSSQPVKVCGLEPSVPYVVKLEYRNERWDIQEIEGSPGETINVFHDFGGKIKVRATPMQRCKRYFRSKEYKRAIEICRVAVTQSETIAQRVNALVTQARAFIELGDRTTGCDTLHSALGTAVLYRDFVLESMVQDWRSRHACGPRVRLESEMAEAREKSVDPAAARAEADAQGGEGEAAPEDHASEGEDSAAGDEAGEGATDSSEGEGQ